MMSKADYQAHCALANDPLRARGDLLEELAGRLSRFFNAFPEDLLERARDPKLTITDPIAGTGDLEHRLIIPYGEDEWSMLLVRAVPHSSGRRGVTLQTRLSVTLDCLGDFSAWPHYKQPEADVSRFLAIVERFLADPDTAISRTGECCVFCGRALKDDASRLRGIGPDCYEWYGDLMQHLRPHHPKAA